MVHPTVRVVPIDFSLSTDLFCVDPAALAGHQRGSIPKAKIATRTMAKSIADEAVAVEVGCGAHDVVPRSSSCGLIRVCTGEWSSSLIRLISRRAPIVPSWRWKTRTVDRAGVTSAPIEPLP